MQLLAKTLLTSIVSFLTFRIFLKKIFISILAQNRIHWPHCIKANQTALTSRFQNQVYNQR